MASWRFTLHVVCEALAYAIGFAVYRRLRARDGDAIDAATRWTVIAAAAVGAAVGSKVLFWAEDPVLTLAYWRDPAYLLGGKTIVGGLVGGLMGVEFAKRIVGERRSTGDLFVLPLCIGMAIGRVGCFIAGPADRTWGRPTASLFGVDGGDGIARHPLPLYEIAFLAVLLAVLPRASRRHLRAFVNPTRQPGDRFKLFMIGYMLFRLAADGLKDDPTVAAGLTSIQWTCIAVLVYYARDIVRLARAPRAAVSVAS